MKRLHVTVAIVLSVPALAGYSVARGLTETGSLRSKVAQTALLAVTVMTPIFAAGDRNSINYLYCGEHCAY